jgi:hypothetical protein
MKILARNCRLLFGVCLRIEITHSRGVMRSSAHPETPEDNINIFLNLAGVSPAHISSGILIISVPLTFSVFTRISFHSYMLPNDVTRRTFNPISHE